MTVITPETRLRRLKHLHALLLRNAFDEKGARFHLSAWIGKVNEDTTVKSTFDRPPDVDKLGFNCGTAACVLGLACLDPDFRSEGLTIAWSAIGDMLRPHFDGFSDYNAGREFFGLTFSETNHLFDPWFYPPWALRGRQGELEAARRVENLIRLYS